MKEMVDPMDLRGRPKKKDPHPNSPYGLKHPLHPSNIAKRKERQKKAATIRRSESVEEGTWHIPDSPKLKSGLKKLMSKPIKLGKEGDDATNKIGKFIGDDELYDDLYVAGKKNPNGDARDVIKKAMKRLRIKEEVNEAINHTWNFLNTHTSI